MITGVHTMFYTSQADELRAFLRDKLDLHATDVGEGWLIFDLPEAEMGCHPADPEKGANSGTHDISFYCDDVEKTVAELKAKGVEFNDGVADMGYGLVTRFRVPGDFTVQLFQPRYVKEPLKMKTKKAPTKKTVKKVVKKEVKKAMKKAVKKVRR
jgi:catechol 2,3-dioxygenase-like lactoylglutathione lyase family enzyme